MPLSGMFKKSSKQKTSKNPSKDEVFGSPTLQKNRVDAATEVMGIFDRHFRTPQGIHPGTVLSATSWLAGTSLYRSFGYDQETKPGTMILSEKANQEWPKLMDLFTYYMFQGGTNLKPDQFILQVPDIHKPLKTILQIQEAHQDEYNAIMKKHGLDYMDGARAGIIVCSMLFNYHCVKRQDIDPRLGAGIISTGIVTGVKTSPTPLKLEGSIPVPTTANNAQNNQLVEVVRSIAENSTSGFGTRLVLGEGMETMQEALSNGGKYILVNPGVLSKLEESNIDPFLVYEAAMRIEVEAKIPQIDFVKANVDVLVQKWSGKPHDQAPIYIRQMLWLKANAENYGYQQSGNSWTLKR